jgi:hypothetical protein
MAGLSPPSFRCTWYKATQVPKLIPINEYSRQLLGQIIPHKPYGKPFFAGGIKILRLNNVRN